MKKIKNFFILSMLFASIPALNIIAAKMKKKVQMEELKK